MADRVVHCVDDEALILLALRYSLGAELGAGYRVETCADPSAALDVLRDLLADGEEVPCVVSDWRMPGLRGDEFLRRIRAEHPEIGLILLTGYAEGDLVQDLAGEIGLAAVFQKPCATEDLAAAIRDAVPC